MDKGVYYLIIHITEMKMRFNVIFEEVNHLKF